MNYIEAVIIQINSVDNINIVTFKAQDQELCMMSLELNSTLVVGSEVVLGVKATSIALAKELHEDISISNQLKTKIVKIDNGKILSSIKLHFADTKMESIITQKSSSRMKLKEDDEVIALIKASELSIVEVK